MTRELELLAPGRLAWEANRSMPGVVQAVANPPTAADAYRLKLDPDQLRALKPERPGRLAREAGEDKRTYDIRSREATAAFREASNAFRALQAMVRGLPGRFEARRPEVVWALFEVSSTATDLGLRARDTGRWQVSKADFDVLGRLAAGASSRGAAAVLTAEQAADVAALARVVKDMHPWAQRAAAVALAGSGYLAAAQPGLTDPVGRVARRLLESGDRLARHRVVYALATLEPATPAAAALLAAAAQPEGGTPRDVAVDAAAVRAALAVARRGDADPAARGAPVDLASVGRVVSVANQMMQDPAGPDAGAVVRELLAATADAGGRARARGVSETDAALIGGLNFVGLVGERFDSAAAAVVAAAGERPVVAGGWLNRQLLGASDRRQVEQTLDLLGSMREPAPAVGVLARGLRRLVLREAGAAAEGGAPAGAGRPLRLSGGLPLDSPNHALFRLLSSGDPLLRQRGWRALRYFEIPASAARPAVADGGEDLMAVVLNAALARPATPPSLVDFLERQSVGAASTAALVRVTAEGDARASRRAGRALVGSGRDVAAALATLEAQGRSRFGARLYDRLTGGLAPVTGLLRDDAAGVTAFFGGAVADGRLPEAAAWAEAAGGDDVLFALATGPDDALASGAIAALAADAGADTAGQLGAIGALRDQRRGLSPGAFAQRWAKVRQAIYTGRLAEAAGPYRLVVTVRGRLAPRGEGGGLAQDAVLGTDPSVAVAAVSAPGDGQIYEERLVLGVVELVVDGGRVRLSGGTLQIAVPDDRLGIRLPEPGELKNLPVDELQDLPLERVDGAIDLLPDGRGGWRGGAPLVDGRSLEVHMERGGR